MRNSFISRYIHLMAITAFLAAGILASPEKVSSGVIETALNGTTVAAQSTQIPDLIDPYWQQKADNSIMCTLNPETHMLTGSNIISYTNNSPDTLDAFYLHLYPNAYREKASPLIEDHLPGVWTILVGLTGSARGWIDITSLTVNGDSLSFDVDGTILSATFPRPLVPGRTVSIEVHFSELVRKKLGRSGFLGDHYALGQWYPKMVVYDKNGWHADQFRKGEFYGEFGDFDVEITIPDEFVIASTGILVSGDAGWEKALAAAGEKAQETGGQAGTADASDTYGHEKTVKFRAENVHDFAWCADPEFALEKAEYNGYEIRSFYRKWNSSWADSALARGVRCMKWMEDFAGPYGYPQISIVDVHSGGGMEYPMLVMNGSADEDLMLHEIGHNWFYGMLANDEREEAWMDEGMTTYQTYLRRETEFGPYGDEKEQSFLSSFKPRKIWDRLSRQVIYYHRTGFAERVATPYHEFNNCGRTMVYTKGALFMRALRYHVGDADFRRIMHTYLEKWKFKHVDEDAFLDVCEEISGQDLGEFFIQWLHSTKNCDYRVDRFKVSESADGFTADVKVKRKSEMMMPLTLAFRLKNGNTVTERVDGMPREYENTFTFPIEPVSVAINPDNEILDIYLLDNFAPRKRELMFELLPSDYYPSDAYQFRVSPLGFYNDIDGGKAGLCLKGSYDGIYKNFTLQGLYGFESGEFDVYGSFENPLTYFGREADWKIDGYYREGRQGASLSIFKTRRKHLSEPLTKHYTLKLGYQELTDPDYVYPGMYEEGPNIKSSLFIASYPKTDVFNTSFFLGLERSFYGSDFSYEKLTFNARIWPSRFWPLPIEPRMRLFFGRATMDPPLQEMFNLAGAGPVDKEDFFWLRSKGAFPEDYYNNFHVAGDANLRGYFDGDFSFKSIVSSNIELKLPFLPLGKKLSNALRPELYLFYDYGKALGEDPLEALPDEVGERLGENAFDYVLQDAGIGIKIWNITAEFPFYLSHPEISGETENWDMRWTIGFSSLF
ncbi:MAG: M1 family metallopeptidase [Bacteroidales bacterium]|nr:M1 family metallopeptidase [Candidatus Latescibacterota bacterium]